MELGWAGLDGGKNLGDAGAGQSFREGEAGPLGLDDHRVRSKLRQRRPTVYEIGSTPVFSRPV
jgi:hypothetical protein